MTARLLKSLDLPEAEVFRQAVRRVIDRIQNPGMESTSAG
jgi:hypothetical protein